MKTNKSGAVLEITPIFVGQRPINWNFVDFVIFCEFLNKNDVENKCSAKIKAMLAIAAVDGNMTAGQHPIDVEGG